MLAHLDLERRLRLLQPPQPVLQGVQPRCFCLLLLVMLLLSLQAERQLWSAPPPCDPSLLPPLQASAAAAHIELKLQRSAGV